MTDAPIIILGSGQAGVSIARELRKQSAGHPVQGPILLISADQGGFYSKPMLSNAYAKQMQPERLLVQSSEVLADKLAISVMPNTEVLAINTAERYIELADKTLSYDKLVLALGAKPILLAALPETAHNINSLAQYEQLRAKLTKPTKIAIVGGGLVGVELANDLQLGGHKVTLIERGAQLLSQLISPPIAEQLTQALTDQGIAIHLDTAVQSSNGTGAATDATSTQLTLTNGTCINADCIISAVGLQPNIELAQAAGLQTNRGISVDRGLMTSDQHIYALGDCAEVDGLVLPYILPIMEAARCLAQTLLGNAKTLAYPAMPVAIKSTSYPIVACPPRTPAQTTSEHEITATGIVSRYYDAKQQLVGFCLSGDQARQRQAFAHKTLGLFEQR
mgnify:CR=1 FL=1